MSSETQINVRTNNGRVLIGSDTHGWFSMSPLMARNRAAELLVAADEAEGERPSHIYQVQAYTA